MSNINDLLSLAFATAKENGFESQPESAFEVAKESRLYHEPTGRTQETTLTELLQHFIWSPKTDEEFDLEQETTDFIHFAYASEQILCFSTDKGSQYEGSIIIDQRDPKKTKISTGPFYVSEDGETDDHFVIAGAIEETISGQNFSIAIEPDNTHTFADDYKAAEFVAKHIGEHAPNNNTFQNMALKIR